MCTKCYEFILPLRNIKHTKFNRFQLLNPNGNRILYILHSFQCPIPESFWYQQKLLVEHSPRYFSIVRFAHCLHSFLYFLNWTQVNYQTIPGFFLFKKFSIIFAIKGIEKFIIFDQIFELMSFVDKYQNVESIQC